MSTTTASGSDSQQELVWALVRHLTARMGFALLGLVAVSVGLFALVAVAPVDPVGAYLGGAAESADAATRAAVAARLGVDVPWPVQWWTWASGVAGGDWGLSTTFREPVATVMAARWPVSALLGLSGWAVATVAALVVAWCASRAPGGRVDTGVMVASGVAAGIPPFVVGLGLIAVFAVGLGWASTGGLPTNAGVRDVVLPAVAVAAGLWPPLVLHLRAALVNAWSGVAVAGARARGVAPRKVVWGYVWPEAAGQVVMVCVGRVPEVIAGTVVVEAVFGWPGVGSALVEAVGFADVALIAAITVSVGLVVLVAHLAADVAGWVIDPRTRPVPSPTAAGGVR